MKILHVLDHSIPLLSGYSVRTRSILENQRACGWLTEHVTSIKHPSDVLEEEVAGLKFFRTVERSGFFDRLPAFNQLAVISTLRSRLDELIPRMRPDILHAHSPCLTAMAALSAGRKYGIPVVYEVRAIWEDGSVLTGACTEWGLRYRVSRAMETNALRRANSVSTICQGLKDEFISRDIPESKITIVPNSVDLGRFAGEMPVDQSLARELGLDGMRVIGYFGSFYKHEGLSLLLDTLPEIRQHEPRLRVLLAGGGEDEEDLKAQAVRLGVEDIVVFAGRLPHDDISAYYSLVEVFVFPRLASRTSQMVTPLKPLEAMAQEKLVVASDVGGHRELVQPGETGLLFRAGDALSLTSTILDILREPERFVQLRRAGRAFVEAERDWAQTAKRYEQAYSNALNDATTRGS